MLRIPISLVCAIVSLFAVSTQAQEAVLGQLYGNGVHAYFAGDFVKSYDQLTSAITAGSHDPRVYYFRGLAYLKLGREPEATQDFRKGAELESRDLNRSFNVARSLERIQGAARQQLETYRVDARLAALEAADKIRRTRFEAIKREEERVLRNQAAQAGAEIISAPEGQPAETDPFGNPRTESKSAPATEEKAAEEKATEEKAEKPEDSGTFGSGDEKSAAKAKENPFKDEPAAKKKTEPAKQSIIGALIKGSESGIKKSLGEGVGSLGKMLPIGKGAPGPNMTPNNKPSDTDPFAPKEEEKAAPPKKAAPEKPNAEKPEQENDPFS